MEGEPDLPQEGSAVGAGAAKPTQARKRKAREDGSPAQPRRLTRSHEACARCRRKKSKCDSKHPSCSACLAAGVECVQEDRYRQTLKPRGYTDLLEAQIDKCAALLNKFIPGFKLEYLDYHLSNYGVVLPPVSAHAESQAHFLTHGYLPAGMSPDAIAAAQMAGYEQPQYPPSSSYPTGAEREGYAVDTSANRIAEESSSPSAAGPSNGTPFASRSGYGQQPEQSQAQQILSQSQPPSPRPTARNKGQDPMSNDLSDAAGLVKAFGVAKSIAKELKQAEESENVLTEGIIGVMLIHRAGEPTKTSDPMVWNDTPLRHAPYHTEQRSFTLPRDRKIANHTIDTYFKDLNPYQPIFDETDFREKVDALYDSLSLDSSESARIPATAINKQAVNDNGLLCSVYLVFALGTLAVQNQRVRQPDETPDEVWPTHEEFYGLAIALMPDLQNTVSTLQSLCALHWYLYIERYGRALWRLVGQMVRLGVELGLHHDPREQAGSFTPAECQLRLRLWMICLLHDRGTSLIFGRPLAVQRADFTTPAPSRFPSNPDYSDGKPVPAFAEHFELGSELLHIQGDIVNSLYRPGKITGEQVVLRAIEIERSVEQWRLKAPPAYQKMFGQIEHVRRTPKADFLLANVTTDRGLSVLKYGVLRMFLLRAVFNNKLVSAHVRYKALHDAVITAHNVLVVHAQLTAWPEASFFVSPVPIHIAAMIILFASISKVETLAWGLAKEDVSLALKLVPLFRLRWQKQDHLNSYPLIARLATKVYGTMDAEDGPISPPLLLDEMYWIPNSILSSDLPPRIEDVWNPPSAGMPDSQPTPVGLGGDHHEQKLQQSPSATLQEQQALFINATRHHYGPSPGLVPGLGGSSMDIDRPGASRPTGSTGTYDVEGISAILDTEVRHTAPGSASDITDSGEFFDVWNKHGTSNDDERVDEEL